MALKFLKLKENAPCLSTGVKVLKAQDYAEYQSIQTLRNDIYQQKKRQESEATTLKLKSIEAGLLKGAEEAKSRMAEQLLQSSSSLTLQLAAIEKDIVQVVKSAIRKIISDFDNEQLVLEAVKKGLITVYKNQQVAIRVNPAMMPAVLDSVDTMNHKIAFLDVQPDERLKQTDCIIEADIGIIDASIESQLSVIEKALNIQFSPKKPLQNNHDTTTG